MPRIRNRFQKAGTRRDRRAPLKRRWTHNENVLEINPERMARSSTSGTITTECVSGDAGEYYLGCLEAILRTRWRNSSRPDLYDEQGRLPDAFDSMYGPWPRTRIYGRRALQPGPAMRTPG